MIKKLFCAALVLLFASQCFAEIDLTLSSVSARAIALGRAYAAFTAPDSVCFNPAATGIADKWQLSFTQTKTENPIDFKTYGITVPVLLGGIRVNYTEALQSNLGLRAFNLNYSQNMNKVIHATTIGTLALGFNLKYINNYSGVFAQNVGSGLEADIGGLLLATDSINVGLSMQNILQSDIPSQVGVVDKFPNTIRLGAQYEMKEYDAKFLFDFESFLSGQHSALMHSGVEWEAFQGIFLRGGFDQNEQSATNVTSVINYGLGIKTPSISFDYAYRNGASDQSQSAHYFSLGISQI